MDKEWSDKNKRMQALLSKEATFAEGINLLLELLKVLDTLHKKKDFQKIQEVLGDDIEEGLKILEKNR